jgi:hypothetical protein
MIENLGGAAAPSVQVFAMRPHAWVGQSQRRGEKEMVNSPATAAPGNNLLSRMVLRLSINPFWAGREVVGSRPICQQHLKVPKHQYILSTRRITLDPVDGLSCRADILGNLSDAYRFLSQHVALLAVVVTLLGVDTGPLGG